MGKLRGSLLLALVSCLAALCLTGTRAQARSVNDPLFAQQWGLKAIGVEGAWDYNWGGRSDVTVAVLDSGVDWDLPDFAQTNFDRVRAYDFVDGDRTPNDENGHGSFVTATIAQSTNNGFGASGIAFNTTVLPIRVLNAEGRGTVDSVVQGIVYAAQAGADIINLSLGGDTYSPVLQLACEYAQSLGSLVVAAAGNNYPYQQWPDYPGFFSSTLVVGALNPDLSARYSSQFAWDYAGPGLSAPGTDIVQQLRSPGGSKASGTSAAAPHVAGVAALALAEAYDLGLALPARHSRERVDWLRNLLESTAQDIGSPGADLNTGYGMVRADTALWWLNTYGK